MSQYSTKVVSPRDIKHTSVNLNAKTSWSWPYQLNMENEQEIEGTFGMGFHHSHPSTLGSSGQESRHQDVPVTAFSILENVSTVKSDGFLPQFDNDHTSSTSHHLQMESPMEHPAYSQVSRFPCPSCKQHPESALFHSHVARCFQRKLSESHNIIPNVNHQPTQQSTSKKNGNKKVRRSRAKSLCSTLSSQGPYNKGHQSIRKIRRCVARLDLRQRIIIMEALNRLSQRTSSVSPDCVPLPRRSRSPTLSPKSSDLDDRVISLLYTDASPITNHQAHTPYTHAQRGGRPRSRSALPNLSLNYNSPSPVSSPISSPISSQYSTPFSSPQHTIHTNDTSVNSHHRNKNLPSPVTFAPPVSNAFAASSSSSPHSVSSINSKSPFGSTTPISHTIVHPYRPSCSRFLYQPAAPDNSADTASQSSQSSTTSSIASSISIGNSAPPFSLDLTLSSISDKSVPVQGENDFSFSFHKNHHSNFHPVSAKIKAEYTSPQVSPVLQH